MNYDLFTNMTGEEIFASGIFGGLVGAALIAVISVVLITTYVYVALAWRSIAIKLKYKRPWLAWIPFANVAMMLQLGGFHWAWVFLFLIPLLGTIPLLVLFVIATWRIFEKRNYPGWFSLSLIIPKVGSILYMIAIGFVAWKKVKKRRN
ncbi:hypothetical protein HN832_04380 [archaeon]|jgi:hypothetical protein|nr:hypothetical protein [archaeon]MBT4373370.1 hypothetical protein [archaeon]MBT4531818.1 hypothetical protein [archaeon]MBT7001485.1 hypothetical protein [archaeon]MBT7282623.1 hypothetical protein [archaeon]